MRTYGTLQLTQESPRRVFAEPLTLAQAKKFLELPERSPQDPEEDALIGGLIVAAREQAEILQGGRDLIQKQFDMGMDYFSYVPNLPYISGAFGSTSFNFVGQGSLSSEIQLRQPLISVDLFQYKDSDGVIHALVEDVDYIVDPARGLVMPPYLKLWPVFTAWPSSAVLIRFTSGLSPTDPFWSDAGQRILIGMKHLISHWFTGRLPFESGSSAMEFPYTVTSLLSAGAIPRVR
jgi:hypothetical protein